MPSVRIFENNFEKGMRKFKKAVSNARILEDLRARESYEKPTTERKRKRGAAKARHRKKLRDEKAEFQPLRRGAPK